LLSSSHGCIRHTIIKSYQNHIVLEIKSGVKVLKENSPKSILIRLVRNLLDSNEAISLRRETVDISLRLDGDEGVMENELQVTVDGVELAALLSTD
jgi:hypothetical protein